MDSRRADRITNAFTRTIVGARMPRLGRFLHETRARLREAPEVCASRLAFHSPAVRINRDILLDLIDLLDKERRRSENHAFSPQDAASKRNLEIAAHHCATTRSNLRRRLSPDPSNMQPAHISNAKSTPTSIFCSTPVACLGARNRYVACPLATFPQHHYVTRFRLVFDRGSPPGPSRTTYMHASYCGARPRPPVRRNGRRDEASLATLASTGERRRIRAEALPLCTESYTGPAAPRSRGDFGEMLPMN